MSPVGTNHRPRIAVVIATVHRPDDVVRAVESVLACSYPSFEVLVVDQSSRRACGGGPRAVRGRWTRSQARRRRAPAEPRAQHRGGEQRGRPGRDHGRRLRGAGRLARSGRGCICGERRGRDRLRQRARRALRSGRGLRPRLCDRARGSRDESRGHPRAQRHDRLHGAAPRGVARARRLRRVARARRPAAFGRGPRPGPARAARRQARAADAGSRGRASDAGSVGRAERCRAPQLVRVGRRVREGAEAGAGTHGAGPWPARRTLARRRLRASPRLTVRGRPAPRCSSASASGFLVGLLWPISRRTGMFRRFR